MSGSRGVLAACFVRTTWEQCTHTHTPLGRVTVEPRATNSTAPTTHDAPVAVPIAVLDSQLIEQVQVDLVPGRCRRRLLRAQRGCRGTSLHGPDRIGAGPGESRTTWSGKACCGRCAPPLAYSVALLAAARRQRPCFPPGATEIHGKVHHDAVVTHGTPLRRFPSKPPARVALHGGCRRPVTRVTAVRAIIPRLVLAALARLARAAHAAALVPHGVRAR